MCWPVIFSTALPVGNIQYRPQDNLYLQSYSRIDFWRTDFQRKSAKVSWGLLSALIYCGCWETYGDIGVVGR